MPTRLSTHVTRRQLLQIGAGLVTSMNALGHAAYGAADTLAARSTNNVTTVTAASAGVLMMGGDLQVNRLGFGAMRITGPGIWGNPTDLAEAQRVLRGALELKINLIDTADAYGPEVSERLIYETLHPYPTGLVIATKGGLTRPSADSWQRDARPQHLRAACEASLQRLHLERIDLYQLHAIDPKVPLQESIGELGRLQQEGKIRHIGVSNFKLAELQQARKLVDVVSVQNRYNVVDRSSDEVLDYCTQHSIAFLPWGPLSGHDRLARFAMSRGISETQAALAWLLARSPLMLPIPGTSSRTHLQENVAAAAIKLTQDDMAQIG